MNLPKKPLKARKRGVHKSRRSGWHAHAREYVWPTMGMRRWALWVWLSLLRQAHRPHAVALGVAIGVWTSFFPILGTHMIIAAGICWLVRANFLGAVLGTWFGNPWTYPLMWAFSHHLGRKLLGLPPVHHAFHHPPVVDITYLVQNLEIVTRQFLWPTAVGGALLGLPFALAFYLIVLWQVKLWLGRRGR